MPRLPLNGVRIVDITVVWAGPFATMILADLGAEVIRVENINVWQTFTRGMVARPTKEYLQNLVPFTGGYPQGREPGQRPWNRFPLFNCHARNKLSCTMDIRKTKGLELFKKLVAVSDVVIENNPTETMEKLGITYEMLKEVKPDIIFVRMPAYGNSGPYRNYRALGVHLEAAISHTMLRHYPDMDPSMTSTVFVADYMAGAHAAFATMAALYYRNSTQKGQLIELSQVESALPVFGFAIMDYSMNKRLQQPMGNRHITFAPHGCYPCKGNDKWINISVTSDQEWEGLCRALGKPAWCKQEKFSDSLSRWQNQDELDSYLKEWTSQRDNYEIMYLLQREGVPAGVVMNCQDCYSDSNLKERGFFEEVTQEDCGTHLYPGIMWKMSNTPLSIRKPPVRLGEDNEYVYKVILKVSDEEYKQLEKEGHIGMDFAPEIP